MLIACPPLRHASVALIVIGLSSCRSPAEWARQVKDNQILREEKEKLQRLVDECESGKIALQQQVDQMTGFGPQRPADAFAPTSIEIASLSGGANYDDQPGDDGVTVHLRPKDADGHVVKVPGRIAIQLLDNSDLSAPRVITVCTVSEVEELKAMWMGHFGTNHYSIKCAFPPDAELPTSRKIQVNASFVDFLTGRNLTASKEVEFTPPGGS